MSKNDGGPAFPTTGFNPGMSLRDWFAGQALAGWLASFSSSMQHPVDLGQGQAVAEKAYMMADAMLAEREEG